jgi:Tfp pilus assembly protein PilN
LTLLCCAQHWRVIDCLIIFVCDADAILAKDSRSIRPKLAAVGLRWASFQVMRRTHSILMNKLQVDPKLVADQLGHTLDVNQNVYTVPELARRRDAVNQLEAALQNS